MSDMNVPGSQSEALILMAESTLQEVVGGRCKSDCGGLRTRLYNRRKALMAAGRCGAVGIEMEVLKEGDWVRVPYRTFLALPGDWPCRVKVIPSVLYAERLMAGITVVSTGESMLDYGKRTAKEDFGRAQMGTVKPIPEIAKKFLKPKISPMEAALASRNVELPDEGPKGYIRHPGRVNVEIPKLSTRGIPDGVTLTVREFENEEEDSIQEVVEDAWDSAQARLKALGLS